MTEVVLFREQKKKVVKVGRVQGTLKLMITEKNIFFRASGEVILKVFNKAHRVLNIIVPHNVIMKRPTENSYCSYIKILISQKLYHTNHISMMQSQQ